MKRVEGYRLKIALRCAEQLVRFATWWLGEPWTAPGKRPPLWVWKLRAQYGCSAPARLALLRLATAVTGPLGAARVPEGRVKRG